MNLYIMDFDNKRAWQFTPSTQWLKRYTTGHDISIGFVYGEDISERQLQSFVKRGIAKPVDYNAASHGGCQSRCIFRGDDRCQW